MEEKLETLLKFHSSWKLGQQKLEEQLKFCQDKKESETLSRPSEFLLILLFTPLFL